jgi:hypothetical protein
MRRSRLIMLSCALLALGCSDLTSPSRLDGAWREEVTRCEFSDPLCVEGLGNGLGFTLATNADSITGTGSWSGEGGSGGPVTVAGTTTQGNVTLTLSFAGIGNVVPPWSATFTGRLSDANTLAGTMRRDAASGPVVFKRG